MDPIAFTGGARIGKSYWDSYNCSWPLASLTIGQDGIILNMPFKRMSIQRNDIVEANGFKGFWSDGIQIQHSSKDIPIIMIFWGSPARIARALKSFGYSYRDATGDVRTFRKHIPSVPVSLSILVVIFLLLLAHEYVMQRDTPDAIFNATMVTLFIGTIYFVVRKQILR